MSIESVTYISDLNATLPAAGDLKSEGDDHIRNLKTGIKTTFPNVSGAVTATHTALNSAGAGTVATLLPGLGLVGAPSHSFTGDTDTGLWSPAANTLAWSLGGAEVSRLDGTGLGIGVTPAAKLHAKGAANVVRVETTTARGSGNGWLEFSDPTGTKGYVGYGGSDDTLSVLNQLNASVNFGTNSTFRMTLTSTALQPFADNTYALGSNALNWTDVHAKSLVDGASATGALVTTSGTTVRLGYGSAWTDLAIGPGGTDRLHVISDGRTYGTALHNNGGAVTGTTNQYIASGTYTPTLTNVANITASTARVCQWIRVGNVVTVSGAFDIDPIVGGGTATNIGLSLPIASGLTLSEQVGGTGLDSSATNFYYVSGDAPNDRANFSTAAQNVNNQTVYFSFTYVVL